MKLGKRNKINFFIPFFEKRMVPEPYMGVVHSGEKGILHLENQNYNEDLEHNMYSIRLIPEYLNFSINPKLKLKKISQSNKGYAIALQNFTDAESYLKHRFRGDSKNIQKRLERLTLCFNIRFVFFNEKTTEAEYRILMGRFNQMLDRRFKQRNDRNENLQKWDHLYEIVFPLLKEKKASLFVIYDKEKPIHISLLYHMDKILFSAIPAYDIDYNKFGIGNIAVYKKIEWCLENNYRVLEMGYGDLEYKGRWSNATYNFEHHILYKDKYPHIIIGAHILYLSYVLKEFLKKKITASNYKQWGSIIKRDRDGRTNPKETYFEIKDAAEIPLDNGKTAIDIDTEEYSFLRRPVYEFQYLNFEKSDDITVYKINGDACSYIVAGKKNRQEIVLKPC